MRSVMLAAFLVVPSVASSQETASDTLLTVNHYLDWEQVADPQTSPDGSQILYTRRWVNKIEDRWDSGLWIMSADGSKNQDQWTQQRKRLTTFLLPSPPSALCSLTLGSSPPRETHLCLPSSLQRPTTATHCAPSRSTLLIIC